MSELFAAQADPQDVVEDPEHVIEAVSQPPVVITEQAVAFSTAAAVPLPPVQPARRGIISALRAMFLSPSEDARPGPRHYPPRRDAFLERAAIARERAQAVTAFLTLLAARLLALAAIGEVRGVHRSWHAVPSPR